MIAAVMGWTGTVGGICAYLMLSRGQWGAQSLRYSGLNAVTGVLAGTASAVYGAWPSAGANFIWVCIAVQSAVTTLHSRRSRPLVLEPAPEVDHDPQPAPQHRTLLAA